MKIASSSAWCALGLVLSLPACGGSSDTGSGGSSGNGGSGGTSTGGSGGTSTGGSGGTSTGGSGGTSTGGSGGSGGGAAGSSGSGGAAGASGGSGGAAGGGGTGGGGTKSCAQLEQEYQKALTDAKACNPAVNTLQCTLQVGSQLACPCPTFVNPANTSAVSTLQQLEQEWKQNACQNGVVCPAVMCVNPGGSCIQSGGSATGTCGPGAATP